jgi:hypothetical protein
MSLFIYIFIFSAIIHETSAEILTVMIFPIQRGVIVVDGSFSIRQ